MKKMKKSGEAPAQVHRRQQPDQLDETETTS